MVILRRLAQSLISVAVVVGCGWLGWMAVRTWRSSADVATAQALAVTQGAAATPYLALANRYRPDRAKAWRLRAQLDAFAHPHRALRYAQQAVATDRADWRNWDQLGLVQYQLGEVAAARRSLLRGVSRDSGWAAHFQLGNLALLLGREAEFWRQMRAALAVVPRHQSAPLLNQVFAAARGRPRRWLGVMPVHRAGVEATAVYLLLRRGNLLAAAATWHGVQCPNYRRALCGETARHLADRLGTQTFQPIPATQGDAASRLPQPSRVLLARTAITVWNTAVRRRWLRASLARVGRVNDGRFRAAWLGPAFAWAATGQVYHQTVPGRSPAEQGDVLRLQFTGYQPQRTALFEQFVAVRPGTRYRVSFLSRRLGEGRETGVKLQVLAGTQVVQTLPAQLQDKWEENADTFRVPQRVSLVDLNFVYHRPLGQVRLHNSVLITEVQCHLVTP